MTLEILTYPNPKLKKISQPVQEITPELKELAAQMALTMYAAEGIGLAAPQVGHLVRLIVVDVDRAEDKSSLQAFINPKLTPLPEAGKIEGEEGCLSVEDYRTQVVRHGAVRLEALTLEGQPVQLDAEGLLAVCLQHEVDHLDGNLFIDRISRLKRTMYETRLKRQWRRAKED